MGREVNFYERLADQRLMKNLMLLAFSLLFASFSAFGKVDCDKTMDQIDSINETQLAQPVGEEGSALQDVLAGHALHKVALLRISGMQSGYKRSLRKGEAFNIEEQLKKFESLEEGEKVLKIVDPTCGNLPASLEQCSEALNKIAKEYGPPAGLEEKAAALQRQLEAINKENQDLVNLSLIKKKLAQEYVLSCDIEDSSQEWKLRQICGDIGDGAQNELLGLTQDNMKIVQFLAIQESAVSSSDLKKACASVGERLSVAACETDKKRPQKKKVSRPSKNCDKFYERVRPDGSCLVDETVRENFKRQERKRTFKKVGKIAAYTALAGGAIAASAWAIGKLGKSSSSSSSGNHYLPSQYRSPYLGANQSYGNHNYSHYYSYPGSYVDNNWIGQQSFERSSPYSVDGGGVGNSQNSNGSFSFGF